MSKLTKNIFITAFSALVLSACGGGGESGETKTISPPPTQITPTLSLSIEKSSLTINENEQGVIGLSTSYNGQSTIDYTVSFSSEVVGVTAEVIGQDLQINVDELENEHEITLTVTAYSTADNLSVEHSLVINLNNASVAAVIDEVELWTDTDAVFKFDDFDLLPSIYAKAAYFNGTLTNTEYQTKISDFTVLKDAAVSKKSSEEKTLLSVGIADYQGNSITENELITMLSGVKVLANNENNKLIEKVNELALLSDEAVPLLTLDSFDFVEEYGIFSGIIGAENMGVFKEGKWQFSEQYQILATLIPALGNTNECLTN